MAVCVREGRPKIARISTGRGTELPEPRDFHRLHHLQSGKFIPRTHAPPTGHGRMKFSVPRALPARATGYAAYIARAEVVPHARWQPRALARSRSFSLVPTA